MLLTKRVCSDILRVMRRKDIIFGLLFLAVFVGLFFFLKNRQPSKTIKVTETLPQVEENVEKRFRITIPDDVDKVELSSVSDIAGSAIATRKYESGKFTHMVLADLPDPEAGSFYEGWLVKEDGSYISTGKMEIAKGGYLLEFQYPTDISSYNKVVVTLEKTADTKPEKYILEGSF